ncbi:MAG: 50S ribosomal protein L18 [Thermoplasmata archaeon]|jgi:large subunit ribosomal protein L18|nr:50S ribosomal protein L18 [Thermoplasmata archaeon]MCI4341968.1 50S ribosomal protein L18 [Thermoplasmata archaeon]
MSDGPRYRVPFRRRRDGRTDYRRRLRLLLSDRPRAVVRMSNCRIRVSLTVFDPVGDRVVAQAESRELTEIGFPAGSLSTTPAAYLTGYLAGLRAKESGATDAILDAGLRHTTSGGRILGALKGLLDAGLTIPHGEIPFPSADRLNGKHLPKPLAEPLESYKGRLGQIAHPSGAAA